MSRVVENDADDVDSGDVNRARTAILNSLVFLYDNPSEILSDHIRFQIDKMPEDYLNQFPARLKEVSPAEIKSAFKANLNRDDLFIVVVGPESLARDLRNIAPVITVKAESN